MYKRILKKTTDLFAWKFQLNNTNIIDYMTKIKNCKK